MSEWYARFDSEIVSMTVHNTWPLTLFSDERSADAGLQIFEGELFLVAPTDGMCHYHDAPWHIQDKICEWLEITESCVVCVDDYRPDGVFDSMRGDIYIYFEFDNNTLVRVEVFGGIGG
jgi:hypothetical protein